MPDPVRRLPVPPLAGLEGQGCGALGNVGVAVRLPHSFSLRSSTVQGSNLHAFVPPLVHQGGGAEGSYSGPCGQVRSGTSSPAFSRLLQPDVYCLEDLRVLETRDRSLDPQFVCGCGPLPQSVLLSVRQGDWMASILKEAYLQVPLHLDSRRFLRFVAQGNVYQFSALCFGLSTAPQVFTRVMAPVSAILHSWGIRMRQYLDDWLVQSSSRESLLHDLQVVMDLCRELGIVINPAKSHLVPSQVVQYLGVVIDSRSFRASPSLERVGKLQSTATEFLSCAAPPASTWLSLIGILSSLSHLVPGDPSSDSLVSGLPQRPSVVARPSSSVPRGVSRPGLPRSRLLVRHLGRGLGCSPRFSDRFRPLGSGSGGSLHKRSRAPGCSGGSPPLSAFSGREGSFHILRQQHSSVLSPQRGRHEVSIFKHSHSGDPALGGVPLHSPLAPVHSAVPERPSGLPLSSSPAPSYRMVPSPGGFSLYQSSLAGSNRLVCHVCQSPMFCLFLSLPGSDGGGHRRLPPVLGRASDLRLSSMVCDSESTGEAPLVSGDGAHSDRLLLATAPVLSRPPSPVAGPSGGSASAPQPPAPASVSLPLPGSPQASASCLETLRRFTRAAGFSAAVASQASLSRRPSSRKSYQLKWQVYRQWCHSHGHSSSRPSLAKVADFLCWLRSLKHLGVSSIKGYRSMLSAVFRFQLPSLSPHPVLCDLLRSFALESAARQLRLPAWDLTLVLRFLAASTFEPLAEAPLRVLTQKVLFLLAFATAKRLGELQALSSVVTFVHGDACLSYVPKFVAKSESLSRSIPRSFLVRSLSILRLVCMTTSCSALCGLSAFIWTTSLLCLLFAVAFSCRLVALHVRSPRTQSPSSCVT